MWYYKSGLIKKGPISDSALAGLYGARTVRSDSLVSQTGNGNDWQEFSKTAFYKKIRGNNTYYLDRLTLRTKVFRAILCAYAIIIFSTCIIDYKRLEYLNQILSRVDINLTQQRIMAAQFSAYSNLSRAMMLLMFFLLSYVLMKWIKNIATNTRLFDKAFISSPAFAGWSVYIPILNLIHPAHIISMSYKLSKNAGESSYNVYDFTLVFLWYVFNYFSLIVFVLNNAFFKVSQSLDNAKAIIMFGIFETSVITFTCVLWIILVTRIYRIQRRNFINQV